MNEHINELTHSSLKTEKKLQAIWVVIIIYLLICGTVFSCIFTLLVIPFGSRWMKTFFIAYLVYFYCDSDAHWRCCRSKIAENIRKWKCWRHVANYFPIKLIKTADLDPSTNYLFCGFPHGVLGLGFGISFVLNANNCDELFPGFEFRLLSLRSFFFVPFFRDLILYIFGANSCSKESIEYLLSTKPQNQKKSRVLVLLVGGSDDCFKTQPGVYRIVLKKRKGFVRMALKTGTPLVPVFSFGETDYYELFFPPEGSFWQKLQYYMIKLFGVAPALLDDGNLARNFFYWKPKRTPIHVVVGSPIKVPKIENPIEEEIDEYHQIFIEKLVELFDSYKDTYSQLYNYGNITLNLV